MRITSIHEAQPNDVRRYGMKLTIKKGTTSNIIHVFILDISKSNGEGITGLTYNTTGLTAYYLRPGAASATSISLVNATIGTWTSGGFKEVDSTNLPGIYEIGVPDACIASGAESCTIMIKGAAEMAPLPIELQLDTNTNADVKGVVDGIQTDLSNATDGLGALKTLIDANQTDLDAILTDTSTTLDDKLNTILGLNQENFYIDNTAFTGANMTSCRIRIYSVAGSVGTASDVIATYNMTTTYAGDNLASYKVVKS